MGDFYSKIVENCADIGLELEKVAQSYNLDVGELWFDLLKVHTLIRIDPKGEFKILSPENAKRIDEDSFYENKNLEVIQRYDICVKKRLFKYFLDIELSADEDKLYVVLEHPFMIINDQWLFNELCDHVEACMAFKRIILRQMPAQHALFKQELARCATLDTYPDRFCIKYANYKPSRHGFFEFSLKKVWEQKNNEEAPINSIYGTGKGNVVLEYIKPVQGVTGRNLKGKMCVVETIENTPVVLEYSAEAFEASDSPQKISYISKAIQYVAFLSTSSNNTLKSFVRYDYMDMKSTNMPMFLGGIEEGPILKIGSKSEIDDAIENNLRVEAKEIYIQGNVGKNVKLVAKKISIEGQLHAESSAIADEIAITNNKGLCKGKIVRCKYADRGTIFAETCEVEACAGTLIHAKEITIKQVKSNNTFYFSSKCDIESVDGNENAFRFSAFSTPENKEVLEHIRVAMDTYKDKAQRVMVEYQKLNVYMQKNQPVIDKIRNADVATRKALIEQDSIKRIYYDFMDCLKRVKILHMYLSRIQDLNRSFVERLTQIESEMKQAKIHTNGPWTAFNTITYVKIYTRGSQNVLTEKGETADYILENGEVSKVARYQHAT
ncbi:DUF342 domain-containing protein [Helicobacter suis]|uniref:DUF342 domain-containing protein n=1 Tax=Helicobacter suis TaxID=104628 RepID=UPI001F07E506|nr:DUF342 domain-containing protein [Helicobacter suis]